MENYQILNFGMETVCMVGKCPKNRYNVKGYKEYFIEVDVHYSENLHKPHNDFEFLPEIKKVYKAKKLVANLQDKN